MRFVFSLSMLLLLAQCKTSHLPKPGEPVRADIDERAELRDALRQERESDEGPRYSDPALQAAFEEGYAAGFVDHQRGRLSDPDGHAGKIAPAHRDAFVAGYLAGFSK